MSELLPAVLAGQAVLCSVLLAALAVGIAVRQVRCRRTHRRQPVADLVRRSMTDPCAGDSSAALAGLPQREQIEIFRHLAAMVNGSSRTRLTLLAEGTGLAHTAGRWCRRRQAWRRLRGARLFTLTGQGRDVVVSLLDDDDAEVRAQAARWVAAHGGPEDVARLLPLLEDSSPLVRLTAGDGLLRRGAHALEPLVSYLAQPRSPAATAALRIAQGVSHPRLLPAAQRWSGAHDEAPRAAAAGLLAALGGSAATQRLTQLCADPAATVRAEAAKGVGSSGHWPSTAALAQLLGDPAWDVRRAAGLALRELGAPGLLFLRRGLKSTDPFAAEMARQALDLPDTSDALSAVH